MMSRFLSRSAGLAFLFSGVVLTFVIALFLILTQLAGEKAVIDTITCQFGLSEECVLQDLKKERAKLREMRARTEELEALYERLKSIDHASSSYVVFYEDTGVFSKTVETGHRYASLLEPNALTAAWCYIQLGGRGSLSRNFFIARMDEKRRVTPRAHSDGELSEAGVTRRDVAKALKRCKWPPGAG